MEKRSKEELRQIQQRLRRATKERAEVEAAKEKGVVVTMRGLFYD